MEAEPGVRLEGFVRGTGTGAPVLVVRGGPGFPRDHPWLGLRALESRRRFVYWHQRGCGCSSRPIDLVGHTFGGLLACLAAIEFPERIGRLLLVAPAPLVVFPSASGGLYQEIRRAMPASELAAYDAWLRELFDFRRLFSRSEAELARINADMLPFYAKAAAARGDPLRSSAGTDAGLIGGWERRHDWSEAFTRIRAPVTMVYGTRDLSDSGSFGQYRVIPGLRVIEIPGADHFLLDDELPREVVEFLK